MRFKTELHLTHPYTPIREKNSKRECLQDFGIMIGNDFGWQEKAEAKFTKHTLEIESFQMDKWVEFKQKMFSKFIDDDYEGASVMLEFIKELESFGKPAVDTKQPSDGNE